MNYHYLVIFSDLDNCLLDRDSYGFSEASAALAEIRRQGFPLILVSSKTRAEIEIVRAALAIDAPFVVESGGALFLPGISGEKGAKTAADTDQYAKVEWGLPYDTIREALVESQKSFPVRGFGDLSLEEIAALTGLSLEEAQLASAREYSEPFLLEQPEQLLRLIAWAAERGLQILSGGRFYHLAAAGQDKGRPVRFLIEHYRHRHPGPVLTMALGDSPNDLPMLAAVDMPVLLPSHDGGYADLHLPHVIRGVAPSSRGWNHHVLAFLRLASRTPENQAEEAQAPSLHVHHNPKETP